MVTSPPATAVALPPEDPPALRAGFQAFLVTPLIFDDADVEAAELAGGRRPDRHDAGGAEPLHHGAVVVADSIGEHQRGLGVGPARYSLQLLDGEWHTSEREMDISIDRRSVRRVEVEMGERVQLAGLDGCDRRLQLLGRRPVSRPERVHERTRVAGPRGADHLCRLVPRNRAPA